MASALQQQLAAIAEKSTNQLDLKAQRSQHSQSLLFESREAAGQTFDTIYQISLDGFEDLCMLDSRFVGYAQNLFSEQSKGEDRTQMAAAENEELDKVIQGFLGLVSGRLLLSPGQKAVEWLVRRFRIHEYNTEYFVLAFLPYHDSSIFATALSILPKSRALSPSLKFLQPYIKSLATVPRHAVLYSAINNPSFFTLLNRFVLSAAKQKNQSASLLGFWASIMAQAINGQLDSAQSGRPDIKRQREEEVLLRVIPVLQEASQIPDVTELFLGCCMITVVLATKIDLKDDVLDALMDTIAGSWTKQTFNDGLACLSVVAQEKSDFELPKITAKRLLNTPDVLDKLDGAAKRYPVDRLATGLAIAYVKGRRSKVLGEKNLLADYLRLPSASEKSKITVLGLAISQITESDDSEGGRDEDLVRVLREVTHIAEVQSVLAGVVQQNHITASDLEELAGTTLHLEFANDSQEGFASDEEMPDVAQIESTQNAVVDLDAFRTELQECASYLSEKYQDLYLARSREFSRAVLSKLDLGVLSEIPKDQSLQSHMSAFSFYMRVWVSHPVPAVRRSALRIVKDMLSKAQSSTEDMQTLLPYLFVALQDEQEKLRRVAAEVVIEISSIYKRSEKAKKATTLEIPGKEQLYGDATKAIKWMKPADIHTVLTEAILDSLEESVVDSGNFSRVLTSAIEGDDDDMDLKTSIRTNLYAFALSHAITTPVLKARIVLLRTLGPVGKPGSSGRKQLLLPAIKTWISTSDAQRAEICRADSVNHEDLDKAYLDNLSGETEDELDLLRSVVQGEIECSADMASLVGKRLQKIWPTLKDRDQTSLAKAFLDASLDDPMVGSERDHSADSLDLLRQVRLPGDALVALLQGVHTLAAMPDSTPATKRRRISSSRTRGQEVNPEDMTKMIRRLTVVLELIESSKPERHPELLKHLFHAIGDLQQVKSQLGSDLVYIQQMILGSILAMVNTLKGAPASRIDRSALRTDLVVDCMRSTSSTQVHNSALLLIAALASWAPDLVLHSVMPIFTFMSSTILRQGDDYSAHIIDQTVSQVIPPLVSSLRKKNQDLVTGAAELLLSFIAAFEHMPMHRRLQLFKQLITALGPDESLSAVIAMLFEKYPSDLRVPGFCAELAGQFTPTTQIRAVVQYIDLVADALQPRRTVSEAIFTFEQNSPEWVQTKATLMVSSLATFLKEGKLQQQVRSALTRDKDDASTIEHAAASMIDRSVGFSKAATAKSDLRSASNAVVTAALNLLPTPHFAKAAIPLLDTPDESLGVRILDTLEARATEARTSDVQARTVLLETLPIISRLIQSSDSQVIQHGAVACVDKIVDKFGKKDLPAVIDAAKVIASPAALGQPTVAIQVISLFALTTMIEVLRDDIIGILPGVIDKVLEHLERSVTTQPSVRLCDASLTLLTTTLDYLPFMISKAAMTRIIQSSIDAGANPDLAISTRRTRESFVNLAAKTIDLKLTLGAVEASIDRAYSHSVDGCEELLNIIDKIVTTATKSAMSKHHNAILSILQRTFDLRNRVISPSDDDDNEEDEPEEAELDALDTQRDATMMKAIMKLNDATFRPFFVSVVEWATEASSDTTTTQTPRQLSLYTFLTTFFSTLKSLVTSYASYILDPTITSLTTLSVTDKSSRPLLSRITATLTATFTHDQDDFWAAPTHFTKTSSALIAQLRKCKGIAKEDSIALIPTIVELASAASASQDHLKQLNGELLKMMRARETHVRMAAVKTERALTERLGEDWLALLPEMLPFIGEVQEDEDEGVEREVAGWIKGIEGVLGESLEGMLQ
ncbi:BP28CT (NUC211) domain-containing protein [Elsinoe australis]|uniref:U3 small nucleolar RNA-associated protein 10 n=1 Tax=Elsinoe australis TaxID=40998 RepID=A0A4U7AVB7_9PEZI|nr:BP28CT (NUC211) domain-containing protein [Elsinoe australis]